MPFVRLVVVSAASALVINSSACAALLFTNGNIITNPTGGTSGILGQPVSQQEATLIPSVGTALVADRKNNFNQQAGGLGQAVADDFVVPASGWDLDVATFYGFQTTPSGGSIVPPPPAPIAKVRINLWNAAPYSANSPAPVPNPLPTPLLSQDLELTVIASRFVAYRTAFNTNANGTRPIYAYDVSLDSLPDLGKLDAGTYWLQWSFINAANDNTNIFVHPVNPRSTAFNLNGRQFNDIAATGVYSWFEARDGYQSEAQPGFAMAFPFELNGSVVPEPSSIAVLGGAAILLGLRARKTFRTRG